jgi:hypothetical protein
MQFEAYPPIRPTEILGNAWWIYASGDIEQETPLSFEKLVSENRIPGHSIVFFDSLGGNLYAGMDLGRMIRRQRLITYIGSKGEIQEFGPDIGRLHLSKPGHCMSACSLAFLGGIFRYRNGGVYGVHRFYSTAEPHLDSDQAQIISGAILQYLREMGVEPELFNEMTEAGRSDVKILTEDRLLALKVINNGHSDTQWTLEAAGSHGLYLKGYRDTIWGEQKLMFLTTSGESKLVAIAMFHPQGNGNSSPRVEQRFHR